MSRCEAQPGLRVLRFQAIRWFDVGYIHIYIYIYTYFFFFFYVAVCVYKGQCRKNAANDERPEPI